ncbi:MAG: YjbH domain-containing protein [Alphaproteobacteria bacterium]|nr:YjbH domain-containing protein [Alphaproteobacteria bacterium]
MIFLLITLVGTNATAQANDSASLPRHYKSSTNETGTLGLNTIPSARMDEAGTIRIGAGTSDPYLHSFIGFQFTDSLYVSLRQTAEVSSLNDSPNAFYPGLDFKLRLWQETATRPAMVIGMDSAVGHKRMASEYIAFSKRFKNFDFTNGLAWGRLGSAGHIKNPLAPLSSHFEKNRNYNDLNTQDIEDWFTGEEVGIFGGIEYFTPLKGLSLKIDYGANDYKSEKNISGFNAPEPWAISLNYTPIDQANLSAGIIGGEKIMARLSLQDQLFDWPGKSGQRRKAPDLISPRPFNKTNHDAVTLALSPYHPSARQIGQTARLVANDTAADQEKITLALHHKGLKGPVVTLMRDDLEKGVLDHQRSPEEIWRNSLIGRDTSSNFNFRNLLDGNLFKKK